MDKSLFLNQSQVDEILCVLKKFDNDIKLYEIPIWLPNHKSSITYSVATVDKDNTVGAMTHSLYLKGKSAEEQDKSLTFFHKVSRNCICRLDYGKHMRVHLNPNGDSVKGPHLHVFREGYWDSFAVPLEEVFPDYDGDQINLIKMFLDYCHIKYDNLAFQGGLYA